MARDTFTHDDYGAAMRSIVKVQTIVVRGKPMDSLELECGHVVVSKFVGKRAVGQRTRCGQCRR